MSVKIALAGNPNSGKTTLFNALTGSNQFVGNWPGVTVEKKEGKLKGHKDVIIMDLPGIYSLSPYTLEEVSNEIKQMEEAFDDDTESIITNERYVYISSIIGDCVTKAKKEKLTTSDKIDRIVTNRWAALPIFALIAGAFFDNAGWVSWSAYFIGVAAIICSGIILKKTKMFAGDPAPFVMELPAYHWPTVSNVLRSIWERGWSFIKKAGTIILLSTIVLWFLMSFGWTDGGFGMLEAEQLDESILAAIGNAIAWIFAPLGWTQAGEGWKMAVAAVTGLIAKENVVATFGLLFGFAEVAEDGAEIWGSLASVMTPIAAYGFLVFNLLCALCFAAMGAIKREMNNAKWFWFAIGYQCVLAYVVALCIYQIGTLITTGAFGVGTVVALLLIIGLLYLLFRPYKERR